jgi:hypothetical protein
MLFVARRRGILQARAFSSAANVAGSSNSPSVHLSPEKMRALIAMYHQTETFVTPDNLEEKINEAFTGRGPDFTQERQTLSLRDFETILSDRKTAPTVTEWNSRSDATFTGPSTQNGGDTIWSDADFRVRDLKVIEALYGVETLGVGKALPGLETLEDNADNFETSAKEDRARYDESDY